MTWEIFGHIADVLGVVSFFLSLGILKKITTKAEMQKETYKQERDALLNYLIALQRNIWDDGLTTDKIQDQLQTKMFEYQMKYLFISSPRCFFHTFRCSYLLKQGLDDTNKKKIREDLNFLIARLSKKE